MASFSDSSILNLFLFSLPVVMSLIWAFFSHLLGKCLRRRNPSLEVVKLGFIALGTFSVVWWPYLHSKKAILQDLSRLARFDRGIYMKTMWPTFAALLQFCEVEEIV